MVMWAIQIVLALAFGAAGTMKLVRSKAQLAANPHMGWVHSVPEDRIKLLGVAEVLGAIGLGHRHCADADPCRRSVSCHAHGRSRGDAYDAWRVRDSFNDPRRVGDCRGSVPMMFVV